MQHTETAIQIECELACGQYRGHRPIQIAQDCARQGDVTLTRVGDQDTGPHTPTPAGGIVIAAGMHGEHRLCAAQYRDVGKGRISVGEGAYLVHTDVPTDRHDPVGLQAGTYLICRAQEVVAGEVVQVRD